MKGSPFVREVQALLAEKGAPRQMQGVTSFPAPPWFAEIDFAAVRVDGARWPRLAACFERVHGRPSLAACTAGEGPIIPRSDRFF